MRIVIDTNGDAHSTSVTFNGKKQVLSEFNFSVKAGGKCKLQLKRVDLVTHEVEFTSMYGADFTKYGEVTDGKEFIGASPT